jgi:hypothetical protein
VKPQWANPRTTRVWHKMLDGTVTVLTFNIIYIEYHTLQLTGLWAADCILSQWTKVAFVWQWAGGTSRPTCPHFFWACYEQSMSNLAGVIGLWQAHRHRRTWRVNAWDLYQTACLPFLMTGNLCAWVSTCASPTARLIQLITVWAWDTLV